MAFSALLNHKVHRLWDRLLYFTFSVPSDSLSRWRHNRGFTHDWTVFTKQSLIVKVYWLVLFVRTIVIVANVPQSIGFILGDVTRENTINASITNRNCSWKILLWRNWKDEEECWDSSCRHWKLGQSKHDRTPYRIGWRLFPQPTPIIPKIIRYDQTGWWTPECRVNHCRLILQRSG